MVKNGLLVWPHADFTDGRLILADGTWAEVVRPWNRPAARRWEHGRGWRPFVPSWFQLRTMQEEIDCVRALPFPSVTKQERATALQSAIDSLPAEVRALVAPFPKHHLRLVWAAANGGEYFLQLLVDHPVLALLIAERKRYGIKTPASELVERKRHHLLGLFGFGATPHIARVLQRIPASILSTRALRDLRAIAHDDRAIDLLATMQPTTKPAIALLADPVVRPWLTDDCLRNASSITPSTVRHLSDLLRLFRDETPTAFRSFGDLHWFLSYTNGYERHLLDRPKTLAPAPVPGIDTPALRITPITNSAELLRETLLLRHCAITYLDRAQTAKRFFYAVHAPNVRATLCIKRRRDGMLEIADLRGLRNKRVPNHLWKSVREWLATATACVLA